MPAGSMPDRRRPSRVPSPDSMAKLRWVASTVENRTASQNSPGAAASSAAGPGPRAKANSTRTSRANGSTCQSATRDRGSIRRSLPATSRASRHMGAPAAGDQARPDGTAVSGARRPPRSLARRPAPPAMATTRSASGTASSGSWDESSTAAPPATASATISASRSRAAGVQPGVGLVQQPQLGTPGHQHGQRHPAALAGRQPPDRGPPQPADQAEALERRVDPVGRQAGRPDREPHVLDRGQLVVEGGGVAEQADLDAGPPSGRPAGRGRAPTASPEVTASRPAQVRSRLVLPAPFGPRTTTTSPGSTERSTPERAGNRPASATAERRWTAGAMAFGDMLRGSRSTESKQAGWRRQPGLSSGSAVGARGGSSRSENWLGQPAELAGHQQDPEGDQHAPADQVDHPQPPPGPGENEVSRPKASPVTRNGTPRPSE